MSKKTIYSILLLLSVFVLKLSAAVYLNGGYETSSDIYKNSDYQWKFVLPWHRLEFRLTALPLNKAEFFLKTYANVDSDISINSEKYKYQLFQLAESHVHYTIGTKDKVELYLFLNELRFYLGDPLFYLVSSDKDKWDEDGWIGTSRVAGSSIEMTGFIPNFYLKAFAADMYRQNTEAYGLRLSDDILKQKLRIGATATYKKWQGGADHYNFAAAADIWFNFMKNNLTAEIARSVTPSDYTLGRKDVGYKIEYRRNLNFTALGDIDFAASWRDIGQDFRAYCSKSYDNNREYDRQEYNIDAKYRVPLRAVTFTYHRYYFQRHSLPYHESGDFFETYIEFVKDINVKMWYQTTHQVNTESVNVVKLDGSSETVYLQDDVWQHFFSQIEMQNAFYQMKLQFKIKNIYTDYMKYIYGTEMSFNLTEKIKILNRMLIVDERYRTRSVLWAQIQYNLGSQADFYLSYGSDYFVDNDLANDDDFVDSDSSMEHKVHLYIKVSF